MFWKSELDAPQKSAADATRIANQFSETLAQRFERSKQAAVDALETINSEAIKATQPRDIRIGLAREAHRPIRSVAEEFKQNPGKGWGVIAQDLGIKPGSTEFHQLKRDAKGSLNYMNSTAKSKQQHEQKMKKASQGKSHGK